MDVFYKLIDLFRISRFVFFQNLAVPFKRKTLLLLKYLENKLDQDDIEKMNGLMPAALVPQHCIVELKGLNGIAIFNLLFCNGVQDDVQKGVHLGFRIIFVVSQGISKFKLIEILVRMVEHDLPQALFLLG